MADEKQGKSGSIVLGLLWRWAVLFISIPFLIGLFSPIRFRAYEQTQAIFVTEMILSIVLANLWVRRSRRTRR